MSCINPASISVKGALFSSMYMYEEIVLFNKLLIKVKLIL